MPSWPKPTPDQIARTVALLARKAQTAYFFDRLDNPNWVGPLDANGLFDHPPDIQVDESGEGWTAPPWAQSRYLARMASSAPAEVLPVLRKISASRNPLVRADVVDALISMPPGLATELVDRVESWCAEPYFLLPDKIRRLVTRLAEGNATDSSLRISRRLLATHPLRTGRTNAPLLFPEAVSALNQFDYESVLSTFVESVVPKAGLGAIALLCDVLIEALTAASKTEQLEADYLSYSWRSAIEDHPQNSEVGGIKSLVVTALRDAAARMVVEERATLDEVLHVLERRESMTLLRIRLHLLTRFIDANPGMAVEAFADRSNFDSIPLRHEYYHLSAAAFVRAPGQIQQQVLQWIDDGADRQRIAESLRDRTGVDPDAEEVERIVRMRQRDRLRPFAEHLPEDWAARYAAMVGELGTPSHPDFLIWHGEIRYGDTSPVTGEDISRMTPTESIAFVLAWEPQPAPDAPSRAGLGQEFRRDVAKRPADYLEAADALLHGHPTFLRSMFEGLDDAAKAGIPFDQGAALLFAQHVLELPDMPETPVYLEQDPGLNWTRRAILELVEGTLQRNQLLPEHAVMALRILEQLAEDPDPTPSSPDESAARAIDIAINSIRGRTVEALIRFAAWLVAVGIRPAGHALEDHEVGSILDRRLDLERERSLAVRSIFGMTLANVVTLDSAWISNRIARYFPQEAPPAAQVVWNAYISFNAPAEHLYRLLESQYADAVARLPSGPAEPGRIGADYRLGEHLTHLYLGGTVTLDGALGAFFERADVASRTHALEYVGRLLQRMSQAIEPLIERAQAVWASRRAATLQSIEPGELRSFGWWFGAGLLDAAWRLDELKTLLSADLVPEPGFVIVQELIKLAPKHPDASLEVLGLFLSRDRPGLIAGAFEEEIGEVLEVVVRSGSDATRRAVTELAHRLGEVGYASLRRFAT